MGMKTRKARPVVYTKAKLACGAGVNWQARAQYFLTKIMAATFDFNGSEWLGRVRNLYQGEWHCPRPLSRGAFCSACANIILFGAFGAILIFSVRFRRIGPLFVIFFWRGMEENDKSTTISSSVDTRGVCWPLGWGYVNDQSANKTRTKPENLKFEIWFTEDQDL